MKISSNRHPRCIAALVAFAVISGSCGNSVEDTKAPEQPVIAQTTAPATSVNDLHWLAGWWQNINPEGTAFESWKVNENGSMSGSSGFIKGKDTMQSETISVEAKDNAVLYIPTVKGQNNDQPVPFTLTSAVGDSFVFENPAHDFPDKITYRKVSATALVARISGKMNGQEHSETFEMSRP